MAAREKKRRVRYVGGRSMGDLCEQDRTPTLTPTAEARGKNPAVWLGLQTVRLQPVRRQQLKVSKDYCWDKDHVDTHIPLGSEEGPYLLIQFSFCHISTFLRYVK